MANIILWLIPDELTRPEVRRVKRVKRNSYILPATNTQLQLYNDTNICRLTPQRYMQLLSLSYDYIVVLAILMKYQQTLSKQCKFILKDGNKLKVMK